MVGCINVVFTEEGWNSTDGWFVDHHLHSVQMPLHHLLPSGKGALSFLRGIPETEVARLHQNTVKYRHMYHFAQRSGEHDDALVRILKGITAESRDATK